MSGGGNAASRASIGYRPLLESISSRRTAGEMKIATGMVSSKSIGFGRGGVDALGPQFVDGGPKNTLLLIAYQAVVSGVRVQRAKR